VTARPQGCREPERFNIEAGEVMPAHRALRDAAKDMPVRKPLRRAPAGVSKTMPPPACLLLTAGCLLIGFAAGLLFRRFLKLF
jgi:hypothetical protein